MSGTISAKSLIGEPKEKRAISPLAGKLAPKEMLVDVDLLAVEITALTDKDPSEHFSELTAEFGTPYDARIDAPATPGQKAKLQELPTEDVKQTELVGEPIISPIGVLKVVTAAGCFAARPSGAENLYKIYAESFRDQPHLDAAVNEAQRIVDNVLL